MKGSRSLVWYLRHPRELAATAASASDAMFNFPSSSRFRVLNDQIDDHTSCLNPAHLPLHPLGSSLRLMSFHSLILRFNRFPPLFHNRAAAIFSVYNLLMTAFVTSCGVCVFGNDYDYDL